MTETDESTPKRARGRPKGWSDTSAQTTIKSLDRAMHVLWALARMQGATLSDLARDAGEAPATIHRILATLAAHDIVELDDTAQTWHVGPRAFRIGSGFLRRTALVERARPSLRRLMEASGETANLGIARDGHVLFVSQVETHAPIRAFFPPGTLSPMHASGIGKVLLAALDDAEAAELLPQTLERFTPSTLTTQAAVLSDLSTIRARGFAVDDEEKNEGMRCIAAPIVNAMGDTVGGLSVSGPTARVTRARVDALAALVMEAAREVSTGLGAGS